MKNFEPQHEDGITRQNHSGTTIVHVLQDIYENCSRFERSVVVWESFVLSMSVFVKIEKNQVKWNIDNGHYKNLRICLSARALWREKLLRRTHKCINVVSMCINTSPHWRHVKCDNNMSLSPLGVRKSNYKFKLL